MPDATSSARRSPARGVRSTSPPRAGRRRGRLADDRARRSTRTSRGTPPTVEVDADARDVRPDDPRRTTCDAGAGRARGAAWPAGRPGARVPFDLPTGRPGTGASSRPSRRPVGRDGELRRDRPAGRRRRGRRARSAAPSGATRSACSSRAIGSSPRTARSAATAATAGASREDAPRDQARLLLREGVTVGRRAPARLARQPPAGTTRTGGPMTAAATRPPRRCSRSSAGATSRSSGWPSSISTAGSSLTDLAAGICVYRETESALAVGLTLMVTAVPSLVVGPARRRLRRPPRPQADHDRDLPHPGGHRRRSSPSSSGSRRSRSSGCTSCSCSTPGSSSSSIRPTTA